MTLNYTDKELSDEVAAIDKEITYLGMRLDLIYRRVEAKDLRIQINIAGNALMTASITLDRLVQSLNNGT